MVEKLKAAIEKAREQRAAGAPGLATGLAAHGATARVVAPNADAWAGLAAFEPAPEHLVRNRIVTRAKDDISHLAFDVLRTRLLKACREHGWTRVAVTSPSKACGKSTVTANLAFSFARQPDTRVLIVDADLRAPQMASVLGFDGDAFLADFLTGMTAPQSPLRRIGDNLAIAFNTVRRRDSAEVLQSPSTNAVMKEMARALAPDMILLDMPPLLQSDDVIAALPLVDAVMLVVAANHTTPAQIEECERLLGKATPFLGVVLNKCREQSSVSSYYEYESV